MSKEEKKAKDRKSECQKRANEYYSEVPMTEMEQKRFNDGVEFGMHWVDNGDKITV